jgi:hypothetical protein
MPRRLTAILDNTVLDPLWSPRSWLAERLVTLAETLSPRDKAPIISNWRRELLAAEATLPALQLARHKRERAEIEALAASFAAEGAN